MCVSANCIQYWRAIELDKWTTVLYEGICGTGAVMTVLSGIYNRGVLLMNLFCFQKWNSPIFYAATFHTEALHYFCI